MSTCTSAITPRDRGIALRRPESLNGSPTFTQALAKVVKRCCVNVRNQSCGAGWYPARRSATGARPSRKPLKVGANPPQDAVLPHTEGTFLMPRVIIIGGGISGLATAYYLAKGGVSSTIIESRPRLGGVIQTEQIDGCTIEAGPDSFLSVKPAALDLIRDLGLRDDVIGSNDHLRVTFVRKGGHLVPLPDGLMMMVPTKILPLVTTGLLSLGTKIRMGMELLRAPKMKPGDESVADFVREHYGQEAVDYLAEPLLSGIYGGDPRELSVTAVLPRFVELAAKYGSLTRGVLASRAQAPKPQARRPRCSAP